MTLLDAPTALLNQLPQPAWLLSATNTIDVWNTALANMSGLSASQMVGKSVVCLPRPWADEACRQALLDLRSPRSRPFEFAPTSAESPTEFQRRFAQPGDDTDKPPMTPTSMSGVAPGTWLADTLRPVGEIPCLPGWHWRASRWSPAGQPEDSNLGPWLIQAVPGSSGPATSTPGPALSTAIPVSATGVGPAESDMPFDLHGYLESSPQAVVLLDDQAHCVHANPSARRLLGVKAGQTLDKVFDSKAKRSWQAALTLARSVGGFKGRLERASRPRGGPTSWEVTLFSLGQPGSARLLAALIQDVTDNVEDERELRDGHDRLSRALAGSHVGIWNWDLRRDRMYFSSRWKSILGLADEEVGHHPDDWLKRVHPSDRDGLDHAIAKHLEGELPWIDLSHRVQHRDGRYRWIAVRGQVDPFPAGGSPRFLAGSFLDITERLRADKQARRLWEQLNEISRHGSVAETVSELADQLNQPLAAIVSYTQGTLRRVQDGQISSDDVASKLDEIANLGLKAGEVFRHLRQAIYRPRYRLQPTDLNVAVTQACELLRPEALQQKVELLLCRQEGPFWVNLDALPFQQVVVSLIRNGLEALEGFQPSHRPRVELITRKASGPRVQLLIRDNGPGIDENVRPRVFDPFFTTKSEGMGMGLSVSRSIVEAFGGTLDLVSPEFDDSDDQVRWTRGVQAVIEFPFEASPPPPSEPELIVPADVE